MSHPAKKRKTAAVEEIKFNDDARHEYLNGFHKRKLERIKRAQELAAKRAHADKIAHRKQLRQERRDAALQRIEAFNKMREEATKDTSDSEEEGISAESRIATEVAVPAIINHEDEYIDEERFTTVTVEAVGITKDGLRALQDDEEEESMGKQGDEKSEVQEAEHAKSTKGNRKKPQSEKNSVKGAAAIKKRKKFRYESKAERKIERQKQGIAKAKKRKKKHD